MIVEEKNSLAAYVAAARHYHSVAVGAERDAATARLEAGRALLAAKKFVVWGGWMDWVQKNTGIPHTTATTYMRRAEQWEVVLEKCVGQVTEAVQEGIATIEDALAICEAPHDVQLTALIRLQEGKTDSLLKTLEDGWPSEPVEPGEPEEQDQTEAAPEERLCQVCRRRIRLRMPPLPSCPTCLALRNEQAAEATPPVERGPDKPGKSIREWLAKIRQELGNQDHTDPHYEHCMARLSEFSEALTSWPALEVPATRVAFTPPTIAELTSYCEERAAAGHPAINPAAFIAHYESKGWIVGKSKMIDWRAAVRTWESNELARRAERGTTGQPIRPGVESGTIEAIDAKTVRSGGSADQPSGSETADPIPG